MRVPRAVRASVGVLTAAGLGTYTADMLGTGRAGATPSGYGVAGLCVGLILIAIPFVVGFFTLRRKPGQPKPPAAPPAA